MTEANKSAMRVVAESRFMTVANGTIDIVEAQAERMRAADIAFARELCADCGHQRNLHHNLKVSVYERDWRGGSGPCIERRCCCAKFSPASSPAKASVDAPSRREDRA